MEVFFFDDRELSEPEPEPELDPGSKTGPPVELVLSQLSVSEWLLPKSSELPESDGELDENEDVLVDAVLELFVDSAEACDTEPELVTACKAGSI